MSNFWKFFWTYYWTIWVTLLVVGDPIAVWLGNRYHLGDRYTDTHFLAVHIPMGLRVAIIAWLAYHFWFAHRTG